MKRNILLAILSTFLVCSCGGPSISSSSLEPDSSFSSTRALASISVSEPEKTTYQTGESLDLTGLLVTANYNDGSSEVLSSGDYSVSAIDMNTPGIKRVTITYQEATASFEVTVLADSSSEETSSSSEEKVTLIGITVEGPTKKEYRVGEGLDISGLIVHAHYSDGSEEEIPTSKVTIGSVNMTTPGEKRIRVTYKGKNAYFTINVVRPGGYDTDFERLAAAINKDHNYTLEVCSYLVNHIDEEDIYRDTFYCIDDKAFFSNYYSGHSGIILQKDQGYILFVQTADGQIIPSDFYSTNPKVGVTKLYDVVAENLFIGGYSKDREDENLYHCSNFDVIAVACNFSGFINSSWFIAPEEIQVRTTEDSLTVTVDFTVAYIDSETAEKTFEDGHCTIYIHDIGNTHNEMIEAYFENPTHQFVAETSWNDVELALFAQYFGEVVPPFLPNASYAMSLESEDSYDGVNLYLTDYGCGDQTESYGALLEEAGFTLVDENGSTYRRVETDEEGQKTTVYTIEMGYRSPSEEDGIYSVGHYYPNGSFQMLLKARVRANTVDSVDSFNSYIAYNHLTDYVPFLPFGQECTKISNFDDRTYSMNQIYGDHYLFYTSTTFIRFYFVSAENAIEAAKEYVNLLRKIGFSIVEEAFGGLLALSNNTWGDNTQSNVYITNPNLISGSSYPGYIQMRFTIYKPDFPKQSEDGKPEILLMPNSHVLSYSFTDGEGNPIDRYDFDNEDGCFYASITTEDNYKVRSITVVGDDSATIFFDPMRACYAICPSYTESTIVIAIGTEATGHKLSSESVPGGAVVLDFPKEGIVPTGSLVHFHVELAESNVIESVLIKESPDYPIFADSSIENAFYFMMPDFDATVTVKTSGPEPVENPIVSLSVEGMTTYFEQGDEFVFDGTLTVRYLDNTTSAVTPSSISSPDMTEIGPKTVTLTYEEKGIVLSVSYEIYIRESGADPLEFGGIYYYHKGKMAGYDTYFQFTFNSDGTGVYQRIPGPSGEGTPTIRFTYTVEGTTIHLVHTGNSDSFADFGAYRPFYDELEDREATGTINEDGSLSFLLFGVGEASGKPYTFYK